MFEFSNFWMRQSVTLSARGMQHDDHSKQETNMVLVLEPKAKAAVETETYMGGQ
jgi:hypothetical protein